MSSSKFETYLHNFNEADWQSSIAKLRPSIHEVDRNAVQIWFRFYPLSLRRFLAASEDLDKTKSSLKMQGDFELSDKIDTSHGFLYGHRYWPAVKAAIEAETQVFDNETIELAEEIRQIAAMVAEKVKADTSLLIAITAVGFMTLEQVGLERFRSTKVEPEKVSGFFSKSPDRIVATRREDDSQGLFGFLKTVNKRYSVIHNEARNERFAVVAEQEIASASANDKSQNWQAKDPRCWEGPVPVECTSASCGTCWVGVIAGQEKLSEVAR